MIKLTSPISGGYRTHYLHPQAIAQVTEAGTSSQWHGIRAYVKTFDCETIEVSESVSEIATMIEKRKQDYDQREGSYITINCPLCDSPRHINTPKRSTWPIPQRFEL